MNTVFSLLVVGALIVVPISVALVRNRRYTEATRFAHMSGWVPGNPALGQSHGFVEVPASQYGTAGPRIVREEISPTGSGPGSWEGHLPRRAHRRKSSWREVRLRGCGGRLESDEEGNRERALCRRPGGRGCQLQRISPRRAGVCLDNGRF